MVGRAERLTTVLVVDDFEQFRGFVVSALRKNPEFEVAEAANGARLRP
jgi:hypothetical protein